MAVEDIVQLQTEQDILQGFATFEVIVQMDVGGSEAGQGAVFVACIVQILSAYKSSMPYGLESFVMEISHSVKDNIGRIGQRTAVIMNLSGVEFLPVIVISFHYLCEILDAVAAQGGIAFQSKEMERAPVC